MATAADLLDRVGELDNPLQVSIHLHSKIAPDIQIGGSTCTSIAQMRPTVDRIAEALSVKPEFNPVAADIYSYRAVGTLDGGTTVAIFALTPPTGTEPPRERLRTTNTAQTARLLRDLVPWAASLSEGAEIRGLTIADDADDHSVQLFVAGDHQAAAEAATETLPAQLHHRWYGSDGQALLPTGHTLRITTVV
ncbi:hypothetical protein [Kitasatospora kifunensis]|uniref:Uncharacterized protein n=1 Tax=Kitasatospora kifunensis TaxID=58351 RepID=A0A7W7RBU1_KITKI|nr:hypothetical protein [Kitasatospora kifunensis]MBB4929087.1 hypothetical protein [Kitasatospora kifunensis]